MSECPDCGFGWSWRLSYGRPKCRRCERRWRVKSLWDASRLDSRVKTEWVQRFVRGMPVYRQRFSLVASRPATERFYRLSRRAMAHAEQLREPFEGNLECDETTFGGARKGKRGWGAAGKVIVFGIVERNGLVKAQPIPVHDRASIMRGNQAESREGSLSYTDAWQACATLRMRGDHVVIRKEKGRPLGRDHINGIEGFWSHAENWLYPYRGVPKKVFHLYLGETCYRFNHRHEDIKPLIIELLKTTNIEQIEVNPVQFS